MALRPQPVKFDFGLGLPAAGQTAQDTAQLIASVEQIKQQRAQADQALLLNQQARQQNAMVLQQQQLEAQEEQDFNAGILEWRADPNRSNKGLLFLSLGVPKRKKAALTALSARFGTEVKNQAVRQKTSLLAPLLAGPGGWEKTKAIALQLEAAHREVGTQSAIEDADEFKRIAEMAETDPDQLKVLLTMRLSAMGEDKALKSVFDLQESQKPEVETRTALQKNLAAAGFVPGSPEFQAEVRKGITKAPLVQVGSGASSEQKELGKIRAQGLSGIRERGDDAEQQIASLDILDTIDVKTGSFEPMKQAIASFAEGLGVDASRLANVAAGESFTSEAGQVVLRIMATQKGPQTDNDRRAIAKTVTRLGNRPEANKFINNAARAIARRSVEQRDFFDDWLAKEDTLKGAARAWNKRKATIPLISQTIKDPQGLPVFFFRFHDRVAAANPQASEEEIVQEWRSREQKNKRAR